MGLRFFVLLLAVCLSAPLAAADWLHAESERFVVHAKLDETKLREVVQSLEAYDRLLESQLPPQTRPARKMQFFLNDDYREISRVVDLTVSGLSFSRAEMSGAYVQYNPSEDAILRNVPMFGVHAQTYVDNAFIRPSPLWVLRGVPAYFATAYVSEDGAFILGAPDIRRPLRDTPSVRRLEAMLRQVTRSRSQRQFESVSRLSREAATALLVEPAHAGLLEAYLDAYASGVNAEDAGAALGDLEALAQYIKDRVQSPNKSLRQVSIAPQTATEIAVRPMAKDEIALIGIRVQRLLDERRKSTANRLERLTQRFPDSALVWYEFAAAEFTRVRESDFGGEPVFRGFGFSNGELVVVANPYSDARAWEAVNRALALDAELSPALRLKAEILMARLVRAGDIDDEAGFDTVRGLLREQASKPEHNPLAAALYFQSYIEQDRTPPPEALDGLGRAFVTNPGVEEFRYAYAAALARQGERGAARRLLTSMLNHPEYKDAAQRALDLAS